MKYSIQNKKKSDRSQHCWYYFKDAVDSNEVYELTVAAKTYVCPDYVTYKEFTQHDLLLINFWDRIAILSLLDGGIAFYGGLPEQFVGAEILNEIIVIIVERGIFKIDKFNHLAIESKIFPYIVEDYEISEERNTITLKFIEGEDVPNIEMSIT